MNNSSDQRISFSWMEFSGSLGDLGLFIPLVVAMTVACDLNIGIVLIFAGVMNVLTGWLFRQPIPVQPMKAIAAVAITEGLLREELMAAGLVIGMSLLVFSLCIDRINKFIPKSIVRGIQLGVGLKLVAKGADWMGALSLFGWNSLLSAIVISCFLLILIAYKKPALVYIFLMGFILLYFEQRSIYATVIMTAPDFSLHWPSASAWSNGILKGAVPQLPLTLLNSVIAVCALSADYFPSRGIAPKRMALSVGLMNLICVPFGAIPMCHGAGGLAAQYRFGARTGGSVIILGVLKILIGFIFGSALLKLLQNYPMAVLGPMLIFAGVELANSSKDIFHCSKQRTVAMVTAAFILGVNTWAGFLAGCGILIRQNLLKGLKNGYK